MIRLNYSDIRANDFNGDDYLSDRLQYALTTEDTPKNM